MIISTFIYTNVKEKIMKRKYILYMACIVYIYTSVCIRYLRCCTYNNTRKNGKMFYIHWIYNNIYLKKFQTFVHTLFARRLYKETLRSLAPSTVKELNWIVLMCRARLRRVSSSKREILAAYLGVTPLILYCWTTYTKLIAYRLIRRRWNTSLEGGREIKNCWHCRNFSFSMYIWVWSIFVILVIHIIRSSR